MQPGQVKRRDGGAEEQSELGVSMMTRRMNRRPRLAFDASFTQTSMAKSKAKQRKTATKPSVDDEFELDEDEQQRLIDQTGILKRASEMYAAQPSTDPLGPAAQKGSLLMPARTPAWTFWDELFATVVIVMPLSFLLLLMHMSVRVLCRLHLFNHSPQSLSRPVPAEAQLLVHSRKNV